MNIRKKQLIQLILEGKKKKRRKKITLFVLEVKTLQRRSMMSILQHMLMVMRYKFVKEKLRV